MESEVVHLGSRRKTRPIHVGDVQVGGDAPVGVQTMTNTDTADAKATLGQIHELADAGAELVRVAVPDKQAAAALPEIVTASAVPLIADIHFDDRLAHAAIKAGVDALRLNPGNIRDPEKVKAVVLAAKERNIPIRVGVNEGSLPPLPELEEGEMPPTKTERMVSAAMWEIGLLEELGFEDIKISLKAFDVPTMVTAYREMSKLVSYPFHLGVTEAGEGEDGRIKSAIGIGTLLDDGIGDTVRVSLTEPPEFEPPIAKILVDRYKTRKNHKKIKIPKKIVFSPFQYEKRESKRIKNIGGDNLPIVISDLSKIQKLTTDKLKKLGILFLWSKFPLLVNLSEI